MGGFAEIAVATSGNWSEYFYVSVSSNMSRSNGGTSLEGIGVLPHESVAFAPEDLSNGVDTLIKIAEQRLKKFPRDKVSYESKR
ncbi:MAG: hypothetical protein ACI9R3_004302 [Verrucomicrobiales bacterium]|jgi:hypothetical protein